MNVHSEQIFTGAQRRSLPCPQKSLHWEKELRHKHSYPRGRQSVPGVAPFSAWPCPSHGKMSSSPSRLLSYLGQKEDVSIPPAAARGPTSKLMSHVGAISFTCSSHPRMGRAAGPLHTGNPGRGVVPQSTLVQGHSARREAPTCRGSASLCALSRGQAE